MKVHHFQMNTIPYFRTFLKKFKEGGIIPIWDLSANYTNTMIGYHGVSVIADAYIKGIHIASMSAMKIGLTEFGPANETVLLYEDLMDSKALWLTPNTTSVYMASWLELGDEPMVIETPGDVLGFINDHYFKYVTDFGRLGRDRAQGGKYLLIPRGYEGDIPEGYFVSRTNTSGHWVI